MKVRGKEKVVTLKTRRRLPSGCSTIYANGPLAWKTGGLLKRLSSRSGESLDRQTMADLPTRFREAVALVT